MQVGDDTCLGLTDLPSLGYVGPQKICTKCMHGEAASRYLIKLPKTERVSAQKTKVRKEATDALAVGAKKMGAKLGVGKSKASGRKQ